MFPIKTIEVMHAPTRRYAAKRQNPRLPSLLRPDILKRQDGSLRLLPIRKLTTQATALMIAKGKKTDIQLEKMPATRYVSVRIQYSARLAMGDSEIAASVSIHAALRTKKPGTQRKMIPTRMDMMRVSNIVKPYDISVYRNKLFFII